METVYQWINFVIFVGLLVYFLRPIVKNYFANRRESIRREIDEVARERLSSESEYNAVRKRMADSDKEIEQLVIDLRQEGEMEKELLIAKSKKYAEKIRKDGEKAADQELKRVKYELQRQTLILAVDAAKKELQSKVESADQQRMFNWAIQDIKKGKDERTEAC